MIVGIDPGIHGGLVAILDSGVIVDHAEMEKLISFLHNARGLLPVPPHIVIEKAQLMDLGGGKTPKAKSMFTYGTGYGKILGAVEAMGLRYTLVSPMIWAKEMLVGAETKFTTKERAAIIAKRLWPEWTSQITLPKARRPHDGLVDAALIAEWGRRQGLV